ncbi:MAG TPA: MFS transporter [Dermatophilaceae bacterium]|nr:MFS transporter [Dermatophilaceae bacterium]
MTPPDPIAGPSVAATSAGSREGAVAGSPDAARGVGARQFDGPAADVHGVPQSRWFVAAFLFAQFGLTLILLGTAGITLPLRYSELDPARKAQLLATTAGMGGVAVMVSTPLFGRLSDRCRSRFGMRRPFILGGVASGGLGMLLLSSAETPLETMAAWVLAQIAYAATSAGIHALLADAVPRRIRARVSAGFGLAAGLATVAGGQLVDRLPDSPLWWFGVPALICFTASGLLVLVLRDRHLEEAPRRPLGVREVAASYWLSPRRHPDFAWAWVCRFMVTMSILTVGTFMVYFLTDELGVSRRDAPRQVSLVLAVYFTAGILTTLFFGWISDRTGRRKAIVWTSALFTAVGLGLASAAPDLRTFLVCIAVAGLGQGAFVSVDVAMMTEVLPSSADTGKDLGILALSYLMPQALLPLVTAPLLAIGAGDQSNYRALWVGAAVLAVVGALAVLPIRTVR